MRESRNPVLERVSPVRQVGPEPPLIPAGDDGPGREVEEEREHQEYAREERIIEREDPQGTADIEVPEEPFRVPSLHENSRDQETRQYKEQLDAGPATGCGGCYDLQREGVRVLHDKGAIVDQNHEDGEAPYAVE